jgi:hypothetical protein
VRGWFIERLGFRVFEEPDGIGVRVPWWVARSPRLIDAVAAGIRRAFEEERCSKRSA